MRPTSRLFLFLLIIPLLLLFGTVPAVNAQTDVTVFAPEIVDTVICADSPQSYSGSISQVGQIQYWAIRELVAGQKLIIDVDAEKIDSLLDAYLEVLDTNENMVAFNNDQTDEHSNIISLDPYLEFLVPSDGDYYIAISSATNDSQDDRATGDYTFLVRCSDQSSSPEFKWPVEIGDLLGATGSNPGSLIKITPETAVRSLPFLLGIGPITDIAYDPSSVLIFVAVDAVGAVDTVDYIPARIVAIDPTSGNEVGSFSLATDTIVALEAAEDKLYGVRVDSSGVNFTLVQVTPDSETKTATLTDVVSLGQNVVRALAYNQSEKVMYGASGTDLVKIDLASSSSEIGNIALTGLLSEIVALDFSHEDVLYGVDRDGNFFNVPIFSSRETVLIGEPIDGVTSLTFVVGEPSQDEEPITTICSSSFTNQTVAGSGSADNRLRRCKLKRHPLHRAIGLFKFEGELHEILNLSVCLEEKEAVESEEASRSSWIRKLWPDWQPKNRVFVVIRDAIPEVEFRVKQKCVLTQDEPTLDITGVELPATGLYYIMVIRPFRRFHNFDYCLSLESLNGTAGESLVVAWPNDESEENAAATSTEEEVAEPQDDERTVVATSGSNDESDSGDTVNEPTTVTLQATTTSDSNAEEGGEEAPPAEIVTEGDSADGTPEVVVAETPAPEPAAEAIEQPTMMGAPAIPEETEVDDSEEVAPAEVPAAEAIEQPSVMGASPITEETKVDDSEEVAPVEEPIAGDSDGEEMATDEETTVDEPDEVVPEVVTAETVEDDGSAGDGSDSAEVAADESDGAESAQGDETSDVVEVETTEETPTP